MKTLHLWLWRASLIILIPQLGTSQSLQALTTNDLNLMYYDKTHSYIVPHLARCFQNGLRFHRGLFQYDSHEGVTVLLQDFSDFGNGAAGVGPRNLVSVGLSPVNTVFETLPANERMNWIMNHELVHIVTLDKPSSTDKFYRNLFSGKVTPIADNPLSMLYSYLTTPRTYSTRWYREGIAAFTETWMAGGLGRALGSYDEMVFRSMVRDSSYFYDPVGLESEGTKVDFQVGANAYLYGTRFMTYLSYTFGPEKLLQWTTRTDESKAHYVSAFEWAYGTSLEDEWNRWIAFERRWQKDNLDSLRVNPVTRDRTLSNHILGSVSRAAIDPLRRKIIVAVNYPGQVPHIATIGIDDGSFVKLCDVKGAALYEVASLAYDQSTGTVFFTSDNNDWRDLNSVNIGTGETRLLMRDARIGDLTFNRSDGSLWGVRHEKGFSTIVRMPPPYSDWNTISTMDYGEDVFDIDVSPDGTMLSAGRTDIAGKQRLVLFSVEKLRKGDAAFEVLFDFDDSNPANFVFSSDSKHLFGTSYFTGVSNVYRYDLEKKDMHILSNAETGFFRPVPFSEDSVFVFRYSGTGFVPASIPNVPVERVGDIRFLGDETIEKYPVLKEWIVPSPASISLDSMVTREGEYSALGNIRLASAYPVVEGYKDFAAFGMRFHLADKILLQAIDLAVSYSPNQLLRNVERIHATLNYRFSNWRLRATYNGADFYDLFGPTKTSRKGYSLGLQYRKTILYNDPETMNYSLHLAGYGDLERLPEFQNVVASFNRLVSFNARLHYEYLRKSLGAVDNEKGVSFDAIFTNNFVRNKHLQLLYGNVDYGIPLPINHSSIWLRTSLGMSFGDRNDPFANFYFGGFGNNWVDRGEVKRFREAYSFPGAGLNEIGGATYAKGMVEWMLPPLRFRRFGLPSFYVSWTQLSLFTGGILTNIDDQASRGHALDAGLQLDFKLALFSALESTFSLGYAIASKQSQRPSDEFMISLKVLK